MKSDRRDHVAIRSYTRAERLLDRALELGEATFEPFERLQPVREELAPPIPVGMTVTDPRRRTR